MNKDDIVLPFPDQIVPATEFRSTWLASSLEGLRQAGHFERYASLLKRNQAEILTAVAGAWVPLELAREHYAACDRLGLSSAEIEAMARAGGAIRRQWHATLIAMAQRSDTSVWTVLAQLHKAWVRTANGGAIAVIRLAPNRARVEYTGCALFDVGFFREAVRAVVLLLVEHVCEGAKVSLPPQNRRNGAEYQVQWQSARTSIADLDA